MAEPEFYLRDDDDSHANNDSGNAAAAFETAAMFAKRRHQSAAAPQDRPKNAPPNAAREFRQSEALKRDDAWISRQMVSAGFRDGGSTIGVATAAFSGATTDRPAIELRVNRELIPPFIQGKDGEPVLFSKQHGLVIPLKDPKCDFAENAAKGSAVLRDLRQRKFDQRTVRDAVGATAEGIIRPQSADGTGFVSAEEYEALQRRLRNEKLRNAGSAAEAEALVKTERDEAARRARKENADALTSAGAVADKRTEFTQLHSIAEQRQMLPIFACRAELLRFVRENSVVVVAGETGSGKTTQVVQYLYESGYARFANIGCTQPRRMAAVGVAQRVAREMNTPLGAVVGYAIRLEDQTSAATKVKFMTDGIMLREIIADPLLSKYAVVVIDEAHERSVNTDVLLGAMKRVLRERSDFRLIVTSATMELKKFSSFFCDAPIFTIPGRTFEIEDRYEQSPVSDYVEMAVFRAVEVHTQTPLDGDILIFMAGEDDVEGTCELLKERLSQMGPEWLATLKVLPCYSMLESPQQRAILEAAPEGTRKCIVATNIAETSLTIDGIKYVIDSGYMKCKVFKPNIGMNALSLYPVSRAQAQQRRGRAGRTSKGICLRLYTAFQFENELIPVPVPEIQRSSIDAVVLLLKSMDVRDISQFDFIDPPPDPNIRSSLYHLWLLRALDDKGSITNLGRQLAEFPTEPPLGRVIIESAEMGCSEEVVTIAALMSADARSVFTLPKGREEAAMSAREKFYVADSDHLTLLNIFEQFSASGHSKSFADAHFLNFQTLKRALDVRLQFAEKLARSFRLSMTSCNGNTDLVRECFTMGFFPSAARRTGLMEYTTMLTGVPCQLHPTSALTASRSLADYVIYNDVVLTGKEYMSLVSVVEPQWLVTASRGLFSSRDDVLITHKARLLQEQRKALANVDTGDQQPRRQQPGGETCTAADASGLGLVDLKSAPTTSAAQAAPPPPKFVPRHKKGQ